MATASTWTVPARIPAVYAAGDRVLDRNAVWLACVAALAALQLALIWRHVPWLDEWQALLIATQSPDMPALLGNLRYEGHPPLWYALLRGLAQFVPFERVLTVASLAVALGLQGLIMFRAPFPRLERLLLGLGEIALFEYGAIARSLALGALAMTAAAALWHRREVWIAFVVLPMCDFLFGAVALVLIALRWRERGASGWGLALFAVSAAWSGWTVRPASDLVPAESQLPLLVELTDFLQRLGGLMLPFQTFMNRLAWDGFPPFVVGVPLGAVFLVWMWQRFASDTVQRTSVFAFIALCFIMCLAIYPLHFRHLTTIAWLVVVLAWIAPLASPLERLRWKKWLAAGAVCGLATAAAALSRPFDAAPQVAQAIARFDDGQTAWMAYPANRIPAIVAYRGTPMFSPATGCTQTFVRWNHPRVLRKAAPLRREMRRWAETYGRTFVIMESVPPRVPRDVFQPLTSTMRGYDGQRYVIGLLAPGKPSRPVSARPCVAGLRPLA
jgi:hypothetical protein